MAKAKTPKVAPKAKQPAAGKIHVLYNEKTNDRKAASDEEHALFNECHPEAGDYVIESSHDSIEDAQDEIASL